MEIPSEKQLVIGFLRNVGKDLDKIVEHQNMLFERPNKAIYEVWGEVRERLANAITEVESKSVEGFREQLEEAKLSPAQLRWEIEECGDIRKQFEEAVPDISRIPFPFKGAARGILRQLFRWLNIVLDSLSAALPILVPVKEFKEAIEQKLS